MTALLLTLQSGWLYAQEQLQANATDLCAQSLPANIKAGVKYSNDRLYPGFAVLLRDTCTPMNRFTNCYIKRLNNCPVESYYAALSADTSNVVKTEAFLGEWLNIQKEKSVKFMNVRGYSFANYIRLYGGCMDERGGKYIVVQFITKQEYNRTPLYGKSFNLFANRLHDKLRFAIIKVEEGQYTMNGYFL
ncbi:hypothetical protein [Paraflavitalea sp. CAU 1676]|uniref:hypothetical protein n=1 Tax=Paraflavitalea sp. CAU 1676 TaxID=3032598 RepID=UPI0023DBAFC6|nr:hypothetical protein [Paraflavitalea sp. CAU 1676]MDF2188430.1 hypothetical protein [Paraflavitalea sp. CAU 1676]